MYQPPINNHPVQYQHPAPPMPVSETRPPVQSATHLPPKSKSANPTTGHRPRGRPPKYPKNTDIPQKKTDSTVNNLQMSEQKSEIE